MQYCYYDISYIKNIKKWKHTHVPVVVSYCCYIKLPQIYRFKIQIHYFITLACRHVCMPIKI